MRTESNAGTVVASTVVSRSALAVARSYRARGWLPIPIPPKSKAPMIDGWEQMRIGESELPKYFSVNCNIGVLLGKPSGWLIDADLDHPLAVELAAAYLPPTQAVFGRAGKPRSHFLFTSTGPVATKKWKTPKSDGRKTIVELRSTGCQTVFPGSVHPSGELIEWATDGEPTAIDPDCLLAQLEALSDEVHRRLGLVTERQATNGHDVHSAIVPTDAVKRARRYLAKVPPAVSGSGGHDATFHAACVLVLGFALDRGSALSLLTEWNQTCQPSWAEHELEHKIDDALQQPGERGYLLMQSTEKPVKRKKLRPIVIEPESQGERTTRPKSTPGPRSDNGRTDHANAMRLVQLHGAKLRFCDMFGAWFHWDGKRWMQDQERKIDALAKQIGQAMWSWLGPNLPNLEASEATEILRFAKYTSSTKGVANLLALARSEDGIAVTPDQLDFHPYLLNCANGVVDLKTGKLLPHDPRYLLTKLAPIEYLQGAEGECPIWESAIGKICGGSTLLVGFVQRLLGCALIGEVVEHIIPIFYGSGSNGKSLVVEIVLAVLGDYAHKAPADLLLVKRGEVHPTEKADLFGKRIVFCTETDADRRLAEALTKELSGGDKVTARRMRQDFFSFTPSHTLIVASNHKPRISGTDHGLWRRLRLIPFLQRFWDEERGETGPPELKADKQLKTKLQAEYGGILAWLVRGCLEWQRQGLGEPVDVTAATNDYRAAEDVLAAFLDDACILSLKCSIAAKELRKCYGEWCTANGEKPISGRRFGEYLVDIGITKRHSGGTVYYGIGLQ